MKLEHIKRRDESIRTVLRVAPPARGVLEPGCLPEVTVHRRPALHIFQLTDINTNKLTKVNKINKLKELSLIKGGQHHFLLQRNPTF